MSAAIGLFLTFTTYGTHLHGAEGGSISRTQRNWGAPMLQCDAQVQARAARLMREEQFTLSQADRVVVLEALSEAAESRNWTVLCIHVRMTHVHLVVRAEAPAERVLVYLKARATHALRQWHSNRQRFWTKHGSTRLLWNEDSVSRAVEYIVDRQGVPMEVMSVSDRYAHGSDRSR